MLDIPDLKVKTGITHRYMRPHQAIVDPELTRTLPAEVTARRPRRRLPRRRVLHLQAVRRPPAPGSPDDRPPYQGSNPVADVWSAKALEYGGAYLRRAVADPGDVEARGRMMLAASMAGVGFGSAGVHIPHACAYPIAGLKHEYQPPGYPDDHPFVPHGHSVIVTAPAAFRFTYDADPERHHRVAELLRRADPRPGPGHAAGGARDADARRRRAERDRRARLHRGRRARARRGRAQAGAAARDRAQGCWLGRSDPDPAGFDVSSHLQPLAATETLATHTRHAVLAAIADGRLEPGGRYSVAQLAEQLGVSRTPVREALLVLEREGRVKFERNRGVRILETTAADVAEVFELRLLLEVPAAAKACGIGRHRGARRRSSTRWASAPAAVDEPGFMDHDERFHELILIAAGNRRLAAIVAGLRDTVRGARRLDRRPLAQPRGDPRRARRDPGRAARRRRRPRGRGHALPPAPHRATCSPRSTAALDDHSR